MLDLNETARTMVSELLYLSNQAHDLRDYLQGLTARLARWSGCEAVGIRLLDGDDFPYYETRGFPRDFVELERSLCDRDGRGEIVRGPDGKPFLACMCGNVILGRTDPAQPFFTEKGSFYSSGTTRLLAATTDADRQTKTRNRCNGYGYESVALVPLRAGGKALGLLQFNDHQPGRFEQTPVEVLEEMADIVATTVARMWADETRRRSEERFLSLFENMQEGYAYCRMIFKDDRPADFVYLEVNRKFAELTGLKDAAGKRVSDLIPGIREANPEIFEIYGRVARTGTPEKFEAYVPGLAMWFSVSVFCPRPDHFVAVFDVITERKRAEAEREKLQAQLLQSQKMEAVGRLAGGVAHDFNNQLTVILSDTELLMDRIGAQDPLTEYLEEIRDAGERSAALTRQLLAFARKQVASPRPLDLNDTVTGLLKMLRRLIGEDIDLAWVPGPDPGTVLMDPSQIDQVLANLVVNARDAIAGVGKITIQTDTESFDEAFCASRPDFIPGHYLRLAVSDNGCGMDQETQARIFEPFFTTKELGKGTGLGLATVYGIVRQNNGFINVYSEPGRGTTFKIYLPGHTAAGAAEDAEAEAGPVRGTETVLLVEDEDAVLRLAKRVLEGSGYTVLAARSPNQALELAHQHPGPIHILITDVVMPGMDGKELSQKISARRPGLKVLFMSGYTANVIAHHGILDPGTNYLPKPFAANTLAARVRQVLDRSN